jgi:tetratricopeptide (TPR) repeat protein
VGSPLILALSLALALQASSQAGDPEALWRAGHRVAAIEVLAGELVARPADDDLRLDLARRQVEVHWYAAALATLAPLAPASEVQALRGLTLYRLARWEAALEHLSSDDPLQALLRIEALERLGRPDEATQALTLARDLLGQDDPRLLGYEGRALARREQHAEAVRVFERALELDPLDADALYGLGRSLVALGERERGLQVLERHRALVPLLDRLDFAQRGVDLAPTHAPNLAALADAQRALGHVDRAEELYERALSLATPEDLVPIALRSARLQAEDRADVDAAVRTLESAAARVPDARLYVRAGDLLLEADRPIEAVQRFLLAGELRPSDAAIQRRIEAARGAYRRDPDR